MMLLVFLVPLISLMPWLVYSRNGSLRRLAVIPNPIRQTGLTVPPPVVLELLAAALGVGVSVPRALAATGSALGGSGGLDLVRVARRLELGAGWRQAWAHTPAVLQVIAAALRPAWEDGAAAAESLRAAGEAARRAQQDAARVAAGQLGVRMVIPLGLCLLPAFVLIGLVPMLLALGLGLLTG